MIGSGLEPNPTADLAGSIQTKDCALTWSYTDGRRDRIKPTGVTETEGTIDPYTGKRFDVIASNPDGVWLALQPVKVLIAHLKDSTISVEACSGYQAPLLSIIGQKMSGAEVGNFTSSSITNFGTNAVDYAFYRGNERAVDYPQGTLPRGGSAPIDIPTATRNPPILRFSVQGEQYPFLLLNTLAGTNITVDSLNGWVILRVDDPPLPGGTRRVYPVITPQQISQQAPTTLFGMSTTSIVVVALLIIVLLYLWKKHRDENVANKPLTPTF